MKHYSNTLEHRETIACQLLQSFVSHVGVARRGYFHLYSAGAFHVDENMGFASASPAAVTT